VAANPSADTAPASRVLEAIRTDLPSRLDRLPWGSFHWLVVLALGASWAIDGLEVTLTGAVSGVLQDPATLGLNAARIGALGSAYLLGAVTGALVCGYLTDRYGRSRLFFATLSVYLGGTLTSFSWDFWSMAAFRWITDFGIGGEYAAINELIPARVRGTVNLFINGSYWVGASAGSAATLLLLDPNLLPIDFEWRLGFGIGAVLGLFVLAARRHVPESPRWLIFHGQHSRAQHIVRAIESRLPRLPVPQPAAELLTIRPRTHVGIGLVIRTMFRDYPRRSVLGLVLITSQAFLYNAIFFTYALVLTRFYGVRAEATGLYLLPFALANFLGPLALAWLFDRLGRRVMISTTYAVSAVLLLGTGALFAQGSLTAYGQTALWGAIFFFASAAASSAYLTVSGIFPLELRAMAIAVFYSLGTAARGVLAPWLFGELIGSGSRASVFVGYARGAALMLVAAGVEAWIGIDAERTSLERIAPPLSAVVR